MEKKDITLIRYEIEIVLVFDENRENTSRYEYIYPVNFIPIFPRIGETYWDEENDEYIVSRVAHGLLREGSSPDILIQRILIVGRVIGKFTPPL